MSKLTIFAKLPKVKCAKKCIFLSNGPSFSWLNIVCDMVHDLNQHLHIICFIIYFILIFYYLKFKLNKKNSKKYKRLIFDLIFWRNQIQLGWKIISNQIKENWSKFGMIMLVLETYNTRTKLNPISMIDKDLTHFC